MRCYHKIGIVLGLLITIISSGICQEFSMNKWHQDGVVDLTSGETLYGALKYNFEMNQLNLLSDSLNKTFSPRNVLSFQIKDAVTGKTRDFFSLEAKGANNKPEKMFFELLLDGEYKSLLSRERIVERVETTYDPFLPNGRMYRVYFLFYDFFVMNQRAEIEYCGSTIKDLLAVLSDRKEDINTFIKKHKLKTDNPQDMIKIMEYYNNR